MYKDTYLRYPRCYSIPWNGYACDYMYLGTYCRVANSQPINKCPRFPMRIQTFSGPSFSIQSSARLAGVLMTESLNSLFPSKRPENTQKEMKEDGEKRKKKLTALLLLVSYLPHLFKFEQVYQLVSGNENLPYSSLRRINYIHVKTITEVCFITICTLYHCTCRYISMEIYIYGNMYTVHTRRRELQSCSHENLVMPRASTNQNFRLRAAE